MQGVRATFRRGILARVPVRGDKDIQSHQRKPIPKVADKIVWLNVIDVDGLKHVVPGMEGESMMHAIKRNMIYIPASCRGGDQIIPETEDPVDPLRYGAVCSECQVVIGDPWVRYLKPLGKWEYDRLTKSSTGFFTPQSRLSCCLKLEKWMNGMELAIPLNMEQRNEGLEWNVRVGENRVFRD